MPYTLFLCVPAGPLASEIERAIPAGPQRGTAIPRDRVEVVGIRFGRDAAGSPARWITYRLTLEDAHRTRQLAITYADHVLEPWQSCRRIGLRRVMAALALAQAGLTEHWPVLLAV